VVDRVKWLVNEYKYMSQLINHPVNAINPEFGHHKPRFLDVQIYMVSINHPNFVHDHQVFECT